jgi:hypothetical protein
MTEASSGVPLSREPEVHRDNRRQADDRRVTPSGGRRKPPRPAWQRWLLITGRDLAVAIFTVGAIVFSVNRVHPIFANQPTVAQSLRSAVPASAALLANSHKDTSKVDQLVHSPQFEADRRNFAADLVKTGRMNQSRADSISYYAVREAYLRGIPPAVVFGVMLTENAMFVSSAMSNVGAVGLMQVYPKIWLKALGKKFGRDLASDSTNLKYGVYILSSYIKSDSGKVTPAALKKGLLHYNGCVHGSNTPNCGTYPTKVKRYVESQGNSICGDKGFYECIAKPFVAGLFGKKENAPAP